LQEGFNYVIAAIEDGDKIVLLDGTEKMSPMGILPRRALNWTGRLVRDDGTSRGVELLPKKIAKKIVFMNASILEDGSVEGKLRTQLTGNLGFNFRESHKDKSSEDLMNEMEDRYIAMEVDDLEIKNRDIYAMPIVESCSFIKENQTEFIGDKIYFQPALFMSLNENPFKLENREYPVDFVHSSSEKLNVNFSIPDGYQIESFPESVALALPNNMGSFKYAFIQNGSKLQFSSTTDINSAIIPANYYQSLKEFYNQMVNKYSERVVLSKI